MKDNRYYIVYHGNPWDGVQVYTTFKIPKYKVEEYRKVLKLLYKDYRLYDIMNSDVIRTKYKGQFKLVWYRRYFQAEIWEGLERLGFKQKSKTKKAKLI